MKIPCLILSFLIFGLGNMYAQYGYYGTQRSNNTGWTLGVKTGVSLVSGDVDAELPGSYELGL